MNETEIRQKEHDCSSTAFCTSCSRFASIVRSKDWPSILARFDCATTKHESPGLTFGDIADVLASSDPGESFRDTLAKLAYYY